METAIEVRDLHQSYGDFTAVRGVSFAVRPGEVYALLGTNGAGKTTTLDVIEGYERAGSGDVRVLGADPSDQTGPTTPGRLPGRLRAGYAGTAPGPAPGLRADYAETAPGLRGDCAGPITTMVELTAS
ncbi:hypothetical protein GCM10023196_045160 [Actinoallomurus vinaceus]|uniref:ABC transporter domain-containing protein n=1 Tax=Actinoallomurus vinaceus TaxID=1080074 RepID=A0ABP8UBT0_9ACTN